MKSRNSPIKHTKRAPKAVPRRNISTHKKATQQRSSPVVSCTSQKPQNIPSNIIASRLFTTKQFASSFAPYQPSRLLPRSGVNTAATRGTAPSVFTEALRFAPTSKGWNKHTSESAVNKKKRAVIRRRYHGSSGMDPFPKMTIKQFTRLPRPLYIESEVLDLFAPAPQYEKTANQQNLSHQALAAQQPY